MIGSGVGAGAGEYDGNAGNMLTPMNDDMLFSVVPNEQVGQLYAYRINNSAVVLGTRRASTFGASIGIGLVANGMYRCLAENDNANSQRTININVTSMIHYLMYVIVVMINDVVFSEPPVEELVYMRFSVIPFHMIVEYLNLTSSSFVIPIFRTALLNVLNKTTQHVVNCYEVQRYG